MIAAAISATLAITLTWFVISKLFEKIFQERLISELSVELDQLTDLLRVNDTGEVSVNSMPDQRYTEVFSGHYWQIETTDQVLLVSRSLWDQTLKLEYIGSPGIKIDTIAGLPAGNVLALSWSVDVDGAAFPNGVMLTVAKDLVKIRELAFRFQRDIALWMALLTLALVLAAWFQVRIGLRPLEAVRSEVARLRKGYRLRLPRSFPKEILPLVDEVNELLISQESSIESARKRAANLAHGLKTPLTVIEALAEESDGGGETAIRIEEQIKAMNVFIERELAVSKHNSGFRLQTYIAPVARRMVAAISKLPVTEPISWEVRVPEDLAIPMNEYDMAEVLGNLLDNARKYAHSRITVSGYQEGDLSFLKISDDGEGVPEEELEAIVRRGIRIVGKWEGHGLGLAIVEDLAEANECSVLITNSQDGGLEITLSWVSLVTNSNGSDAVSLNKSGKGAYHRD